jgi:glycosyltransferase involved in cell wall biosynthesis
MKISIIIAAYNVADYIEKCMNSITSQTYKNLEIIVVNDGSTDNTHEKITELSMKDERIIIIDKKNGGLSSARNAGLDTSTGDYIGFIDGDDYIAADMYETMLKEIKKNNCEIAMCGVLKVYNDYTVTDGISNEYTVLNKKEALKALIEEKYIKHYAVNKLYKSSLFENIRYPEGKLYEDIFTTYKLFALTEKLVYLPQIGYYYTQRQGSILRSKFNVRRLDCIQAFKEFKSYVDVNFPELSDQLIWRLNVSTINSLLDMLKSEALYKNCDFNENGLSLTNEIRKNSLFFLKTSNMPMNFRILAIFSFGGYPFMRILFKTPLIKNMILKKSSGLL